jgi:hypothetical protein
MINSMSNYDPDKIRAFTTEENYSPGLVLGEVRKMVADLKNATDLIVNSRGARISDNRGKICQDLLNAFETTLVAYGDVKMIGRLSNDQQREILVMVDDVLRGKRENVQFQLNRNCDGIKELFSSKVFLFKL